MIKSVVLEKPKRKKGYLAPQANDYKNSQRKNEALLRKLKHILEGQKIKSVAALHLQREIRGVEGLLNIF